MLNRWNPYRELENIRDQMNRLFYERYGEPVESAEGPRVLSDMYETETHLVIVSALPGVKPEDLEITVAGNRLSIRGEFRQNQEQESGDVYFQERQYGRFQRTFTLPGDIDTDDIGATFEDGVLKVALPKKERARPKQIPVRSQHK